MTTDKNYSAPGQSIGRTTLALMALAILFFAPMGNFLLPHGVSLSRSYLFNFIVYTWLPASAIYLLFRATQLHSLLRSRDGTHAAFRRIGFALLVYYSAHFIFILRHGQIANVGSSFSVLKPTLGVDLLIAGFEVIAITVIAFLIIPSVLRLLVNSVKGRLDPPVLTPAIDLREKQIVGIAIAFPTVIAAALLY